MVFIERGIVFNNTALETQLLLPAPPAKDTFDDTSEEADLP
jgi:hypothetical protein